MRHVRVRAACRIAWMSLTVMVAAASASAQEQQTVAQVLSFLLTNQSVQTGDFVQDRAAAQATSDTLSRALLVDIATMPIGSASGGFTYQFNPALGTLERRSSTFGPAFVERVLGAGANRFSLGLSAQYARFDTLDGNKLRNGSLVTTANQFVDENETFDTDTLTLQLETRTIAFAARYGITDRLDIGAMVPLISLNVRGQRVNTYRNTSVVQAVGSASRVGLGDIGVQAKYHAVGTASSGFGVMGDVRLPTGPSEDLLGTGRTSVGFLGIGSIESGRVALHLNGGYAMGGVSDELRFGVAAAIAATPTVTIGAEMVGRRLLDIGRIARVASLHPSLADVNTFRLLPSGGDTMPMFVAAGVKWNVVDEWVLDAHVLMPVSQSGLTARFTPTIALERSFGR